MDDPLLDALWSKTQREWQDPASHEAFLNHCLQAGHLATAAARYREQLAQGRDGAELYLQRITVLAISQLDASRTPQQVVWRNAASLVTAALILGVALALLFAALR